MAWKAFNTLIGDPKLLVLDSRPARSYSDRHIRGSINVKLSAEKRTLERLAGPERPKWFSNCWWDRKVLVVTPVCSQPVDRKRRSEVLNVPSRWNETEKIPEQLDPVVEFLRRDKNVRSVMILESDDDEPDPFRSFARRYPFLVTKSTKPATTLDYPAEIVPGLLYLGNQEHAVAEKRLEELGISHVLTVHTETLKIGKQFVHLYCSLADDPNADIAQFFDSAFEFIENARSDGNRVLVHCGAGASRSATLVASYLMRVRKWTVETTLEFMKEQRRQVSPNEGFVTALQKFQESLRARRISDGPPSRENDAGSTPGDDDKVSLDVVKNGEVCGSVSLEDKNMFVFGRGASCHVMLNHASISRQHAKLEVVDGKALTLRDLDSVHGTFVDGKKLQKGVIHQLQSGEKIQFGASTRTYIVRGAAAHLD